MQLFVQIPIFLFPVPILLCFLLPAFPVAHWYPPCHLLLLSSITGVVLCFTHKSSSSSFLYSSLTMLPSCTSSSSISISELVVIYHNFSIANYSRPQCLPFLTCWRLGRMARTSLCEICVHHCGGTWTLLITAWADSMISNALTHVFTVWVE